MHTHRQQHTWLAKQRFVGCCASQEPSGQEPDRVTEALDQSRCYMLPPATIPQHPFFRLQSSCGGLTENGGVVIGEGESYAFPPWSFKYMYVGWSILIWKLLKERSGNTGSWKWWTLLSKGKCVNSGPLWYVLGVDLGYGTCLYLLECEGLKVNFWFPISKLVPVLRFLTVLAITLQWYKGLGPW